MHSSGARQSRDAPVDAKSAVIGVQENYGFANLFSAENVVDPRPFRAANDGAQIAWRKFHATALARASMQGVSRQHILQRLRKPSAYRLLRQKYFGLAG
jgi:hypothetical protein